MADKRRRGQSRSLPANTEGTSSPGTPGERNPQSAPGTGGFTPNMVDARQLVVKYLLGAIIMWAMLFGVSFSILNGTEYWSLMWPVLGFGATWALLIVPVTVFRNRQQSPLLQRTKRP